MRADTLAVGSRIDARIANDLDVLVRRVPVDRLEEIRTLSERLGQSAKQSDRDLSHRGRPAEQRPTKLGQRSRPFIGALQPHPGWSAGPPERHTFAVDVELLAPIGTTSRQLPTSPGVAAKMRRLDHLLFKLGGLREIKKFMGDGENFLALLCCNAVSGQIEKSDIMRCFAQIGQEIQMVGGTTTKPAQIKPWK